MAVVDLLLTGGEVFTTSGLMAVLLVLAAASCAAVLLSYRKHLPPDPGRASSNELLDDPCRRSGVTSTAAQPSRRGCRGPHHRDAEEP